MLHGATPRDFPQCARAGFLLVLLGVVVGPRLQLDSRTMSRFAYFVLTPAFVFDVLSKAVIDATLAARMTVYILLVHVLCALVAFGVAKALRRSPHMTAAYVLIAVFSNVGNFGLPIIQFQFPGQQAALAAATVYFVAILTISFVIGVAAANMVRGGNLAAVAAVLKTPGVIAVAPALLVNAAQVPLPLVLTRPVSLLAGALIPTMLVALGVQLSQVGIPRITADMVIACVLRLAVGPALAFALVGVFGLDYCRRKRSAVVVCYCNRTCFDACKRCVADRCACAVGVWLKHNNDRLHLVHLLTVPVSPTKIPALFMVRDHDHRTKCASSL